MKSVFKNKELDILYQIINIISGTANLTELLKKIANMIVKYAEVDSCLIYLYEDRAKTLVLSGSYNRRPGAVGALHLRLGEGITGWVAEHKIPVSLSEKAYQDPRFKFFPHLPEDRYESFLSVPILLKGGLIGVINLQTRKAHRHSRSEITLISTISKLVAGSIENAKLVEAKSKFTSMVSHELRTPLTSIKEGIGIVLDGSAGEINEDQKSFLELSKRNVDRLHRLINDVLDFAKYQSGKMEFRFKETDLNGTIREVIKNHEAMAQDKGLTLTEDLGPSMASVKIDSDKIIQVLTNLLNNSIKFTDKGEISVSGRIEDKMIRIGVKDTGSGIKQEDMGRLFQEYIQVGEASYRKPGSSGLGLALCKEIIEGHHGKIWVESEFGRGSEFIFTLPLDA